MAITSSVFTAEPYHPKGSTFAGTEGIYLLPHHERELDRLQKQHALILSSTNGVLITAPLDGKSPLRVLDSGAADGTWLRALPQLYPNQTWSLHGVDIGSSLFPPPSADGPTVDLRKLDIRQPVPESLHWASSFDLIHQRLLIWGLKSHEWLQVVDNLRGILKPGGWIQLVEVQWVDRDAPFDPIKFPRLAKMSELQIWGSEVSGMNIHIAYELEQLLQDLNFQHITKTSFKVGYGAKARDESWRLPSVEMWGEVFRPLAHRMPPEGIPGVAKTPAELDLFLDELKVDVLEYGYEPQINFVIGQKPLH